MNNTLNLHYFKSLQNAIFFIFLISVLNSNAQNFPPVLEWQKCFGYQNWDEAPCVIQTDDGNYLVAGYAELEWNDYYHTDYFILKLDSMGNLIWDRLLGGTNSDDAICIRQTTDNGFIVTGSTYSNDGDVSGNHGGPDYWVVKLDSYGFIKWQKCLGGSGGDISTVIEETADEGFIVAGYSNSTDGDVTGNHGLFDYWVVKLDMYGNIEWERSFGGSEDDYAHTVKQCFDGGYIIAGYTYSDDGDVQGNHGFTDSWILRLDSIGDIEWQSCLGGTKHDRAYSVLQTSDGNFILAGASASNDGDVLGNHGGNDYWIVRLSSLGKIIWQECYGGSDVDEARCIYETADGGFVVSGNSNSINQQVTGNHGEYDYWIIRINATGDLNWQKCLGGTSYDYSESVLETKAGGFITAGLTFSDDGDVFGNHGTMDMWIVNLSCTGMQIFYADADGDGHGDPGSSINAPACSPPVGYTLDNTDCDDNNYYSYLAGPEIVNGFDDNCNIYIDEPFLEWQKCYGGNSWETANSVLQTTDGGYLLTGFASSNDDDVSGNHGSRDWWTVKVDVLGNIEWQKCYGGSGIDVGCCALQTKDGGFIAAGSTRSYDGDVSGYHGGSDSWILKLDALGNIQWQKCLGGSSDEEVTSIRHTPDGGFIVFGNTFSSDGDITYNHGFADFWIVKLNETGNIEWQKSLGGSGWEDGRFVELTDDGGFIFAGKSESSDGDITGNHGGYDCWVVKTDSEGNIDWQKALGGSSHEYGESVKQTVDGGFIIGATTGSNDGNVSGYKGCIDYWIVKLDKNANIEWQKCFGGSGCDHLFSMNQIENGDILVAGYATSDDGNVTGNHGNSDYWLIRMDNSGNIIWEKSVGGHVNDEAASLDLTKDGGFIVAGTTDSNDGDVLGNHGWDDYWVTKFSCLAFQQFYTDSDGDGHGASNGSIINPSCLPPPGYSIDTIDCDDGNPNIYPGSIEMATIYYL